MSRVTTSITAVFTAVLIGNGFDFRTAEALSFLEIQVGDKDGFGFASTYDLWAANGEPADSNNNGQLEPGEFMADLNRNGRTGNRQNDNFDNRVAEAARCTGCSDKGSTGFEFTDISLARTYDADSAVKGIFNANTRTLGPGGSFPMSPSNKLPNQAGFLFDFSVEASDIAPDLSLYLNAVYGDYEVGEADVLVINGSRFTVPLQKQNNNHGENGLIQVMTVQLDFNTVFKSADDGFAGLLQVDFIALKEPYVALDYVEISINPLSQQVPEPTMIVMLGIGMVGLWTQKRRPQPISHVAQTSSNDSGWTALDFNLACR